MTQKRIAWLAAFFIFSAASTFWNCGCVLAQTPGMQTAAQAKNTQPPCHQEKTPQHSKAPDHCCHQCHGSILASVPKTFENLNAPALHFWFGAAEVTPLVLGNSIFSDPSPAKRLTVHSFRDGTHPPLYILTQVLLL